MMNHRRVCACVNPNPRHVHRLTDNLCAHTIQSGRATGSSLPCERKRANAQVQVASEKEYKNKKAPASASTLLISAVG